MANVVRTITQEVVKGLENNQIVWDKKVAGFGVRRQKSDRRTYFVKKKVANQQRWFTIN